MDSAFQINGPLSQTVNGLTVGKEYRVSFYEAAAQQLYFDGDTYDQWKVTFGGDTQYGTNFSPLPNHGFSGWNKTSLKFTANSSSQVLEFLATGGPEGLPPFALLDGVSVNAVPEPLTILGTMAAFGFGAGFKRRSKGA